jgi:hypothetical protein
MVGGTRCGLGRHSPLKRALCSESRGTRSLGVGAVSPVWCEVVLLVGFCLRCAPEEVPTPRGLGADEVNSKVGTPSQSR